MPCVFFIIWVFYDKFKITLSPKNYFTVPLEAAIRLRFIGQFVMSASSRVLCRHGNGKKLAYGHHFQAHRGEFICLPGAPTLDRKVSP